MAVFRSVEGSQAGPGAVGILVPPGPRTIVLVRPRPVDWDLVVLHPGGGRWDAFWELGRDEALKTASQLEEAVAQAAEPCDIRVEVIASTEETGFRVRVGIGAFELVTCARLPGQPYRPAVFPDQDQARAAAWSLEHALCPPPGEVRELYVNARHFSR